METTHKEEDEVVANDICKVRALEVLVRGSQGRGSAGSQAASENGGDDLRDKKSDARSDEGRETSKTYPAVLNLLQVNRHSKAWWVNH